MSSVGLEFTPFIKWAAGGLVALTVWIVRAIFTSQKKIAILEELQDKANEGRKELHGKVDLLHSDLKETNHSLDRLIGKIDAKDI